MAARTRLARFPRRSTTRGQRTPRRLALASALGFALFAGGTVAAQDATFTTTSDLVVLHVTVRDRDGGFMSDLPERSFAIFEDLRPQKVVLFVDDDAPVTVGLVIDNSISMRESRTLVIAGAEAFAEAGHAEDEVFALAFNEHVTPVLSPRAPFTSDASILGRALTSAISARGRTAFFDAVLAGLAYADTGTHPRKVLVVIGDGGDNASRATFGEALARAQASNTTIYSVILVDPLDPEANPERLARLARVTGGESFRPESAHDVSRVLQDVARDIRHTYTIGFAPATAPDGSYRRIRVVVQPPKPGQRLTVRTREGYVAAKPVSGGEDHVAP